MELINFQATELYLSRAIATRVHAETATDDAENNLCMTKRILMIY